MHYLIYIIFAACLTLIARKAFKKTLLRIFILAILSEIIFNIFFILLVCSENEECYMADTVLIFWIYTSIALSVSAILNLVLDKWFSSKEKTESHVKKIK